MGSKQYWLVGNSHKLHLTTGCFKGKHSVDTFLQNVFHLTRNCNSITLHSTSVNTFLQTFSHTSQLNHSSFLLLRLQHSKRFLHIRNMYTANLENIVGLPPLVCQRNSAKDKCKCGILVKEIIFSLNGSMIVTSQVKEKDSDNKLLFTLSFWPCAIFSVI